LDFLRPAHYPPAKTKDKWTGRRFSKSSPKQHWQRSRNCESAQEPPGIAIFSSSQNILKQPVFREAPFYDSMSFKSYVKNAENALLQTLFHLGNQRAPAFDKTSP
jgi:hypothetical protein